MHPLFLFGMIWHVTALAVLSFFVLFAASKAEGFVKLLGNVVGGWLLVLAALGIIGAATAPFVGGRPFGLPMGGWMHHWHCDKEQGQPAQNPTP